MKKNIQFARRHFSLLALTQSLALPLVLTVLPISEARSAAFQTLFAAPVFDSKPELTFRNLDAAKQSRFQDGGLQLGLPRFTWKGALGPEYWGLYFSGQLEASTADSLIYIYQNQSHPLTRDARGRFELFLEPAASGTGVEFIHVDQLGRSKKVKFEYTLAPLPETLAEGALPQYTLEFRGGLHFGYDVYTESNSLATSRMNNIRFPRINLELGIKRGRLATGASWRALLLGGTEYSFPLVGLGVLQHFPLSWNIGLQFSRERIWGRLGVFFLSPFLQIERQGWTFASSYLASLYNEPAAAVSAASAGVVWLLAGTRVEFILLKRSWELGIHLGRSLTAVAWSSQGSLNYQIGGYTGRLSLRTDLTRHLYAQIGGHYDTLTGGANLSGGGFQFGLGYSY